MGQMGAYDPIYNDQAVMDFSNRNNLDPQIEQYIRNLETRNAELFSILESRNRRNITRTMEPMQSDLAFA